MRALQRVRLVGEVGVSNYSLQRWRAAEDALGSRVLSNQVRYSLVDRSPERGLLPFAQSEGRVVLAYSPLAQGLLSGRYDQHNRPANRVRAGNPLFFPENLERAGELIATLREVASAHSVTAAQIALAWVIRHPAVAAIPGASSVEQRRGRRDRPHRRRVPGAGRRGGPVPAHHRACGVRSPGPGPVRPLIPAARVGFPPPARTR
jgi:aryl-alcohol dehydrogenase-like predicted oxidoreductase